MVVLDHKSTGYYDAPYSCPTSEKFICLHCSIQIIVLYIKRNTLRIKNLRDFPKRCKRSLDIFSGDLRAQITHKHMEVI